jgi:hypothetical protein
MLPTTLSPIGLPSNRMIGVGGWRNRSDKAGPFLVLQRRQVDVGLPRDPREVTASELHFRLQSVRIIQSPTVSLKAGCIRAMSSTQDFASGENMTVLATAFSDPANAGTGRDEPM